MLAPLLRCLCRCRPGRGPRRESASPATGGAAEAAAEPIPPELQPLLEIEGIGPRTVRYLMEAGYREVAQVRQATRAQLAAVDGVGPRAAELLKRGLAGG